jgi:hypothetical protein
VLEWLLHIHEALHVLSEPPVLILTTLFKEYADQNDLSTLVGFHTLYQSRDWTEFTISRRWDLQSICRKDSSSVLALDLVALPA